VLPERAVSHTGAPAAYVRFSTESETAVGVNIYKAGSDPPLQTDSDCPAWLWNLAEPPLTLGLLQRKSVSELDVPMVRCTAQSLMRQHSLRCSTLTGCGRRQIRQMVLAQKETRLGLERRASIKGRNEVKAKKT